MDMRPTITLAAVVVVGGCALTYRYLRASTTVAENPPGAARQSPVARLVVTSQPALRPFESRTPWIGVVQSQASVELMALTAGNVETVAVEDQARVEMGATIMCLGGPYVESERARLRANADSLRARLAVVDQTIKRLEGNADVIARNNLATAQESQLKLQAQLHEAQLALDALSEQTRITAPMAGVFTDRRVSTGQMVTADQVLGEIIDPDHLRIAASIFAPRDAALAGRKATIVGSDKRVISGAVRHVLPRRSRTGATIVWIEGPDVDQRLSPGQTVSGMVTLKPASSALAVPSSAVVYSADEQPSVFVHDGTAYAQRNVRLGSSQDGWVEVLSGLEPGQSVVTEGAYELFYRQFTQQYKPED